MLSGYPRPVPSQLLGLCQPESLYKDLAATVVAVVGLLFLVRLISRHSWSSAPPLVENERTIRCCFYAVGLV